MMTTVKREIFACP